MRRYVTIAVFFLFLFAGRSLHGQFTIRQDTPPSRELKRPAEYEAHLPVVRDLMSDYQTDAIIRAERLRRRKEQNTFELNIGLTATQTYFSNWAKGGDNTFNGVSSLDLKHQYKKERMTLTTKFDMRYGMSIIDTVVFKNEDKFNFNFLIERSMNKSWAYSGSVNFRSQIAKGYKSKDNKTLVSAFLSPGVLDIALGFTYGPDNSPWKISLSPITGSILFVLNDELSENGLNGIDPGDHVKPMVGPSVNIDFDKRFARNDALRYKSNFYSFYNFKLDPTARWENTFSMQATKWLATNVYWLMIFDKEQETPHKSNIQLNYSIGVGLAFTYKNK